MDFLIEVIIAVLGLLGVALTKYGVDMAVRITGSSKLGEFAARTLVTALKRGVDKTQAAVRDDGFQADDLLTGTQAIAQHVFAEATSQNAIDMYLEELPDWLKRSAFGSQDNDKIKASPRNLEVIESQLTSAAEAFLNRPPEVQRAFVARSNRPSEPVAA
jgi:hypothetical protein